MPPVGLATNDPGFADALRRYPPRHVFEDIKRPDSSRAHLVAIARIAAATETKSGADWIGGYELEVRDPGKEHEDPKLTLRWQGS